MSLMENNNTKTKAPTIGVDYSKLTDEELCLQLSDKQRLWCHEYIVDWNATRAAKVAKYSEKTAYIIGHENTKKPKLVEYCKRISEDIEKEAGLSKLRVINEYMKMAFSSIAHLHDSWVDKKVFEELTDDQKACIQEIQTQTRTMQVEGGSDIDVDFVKIKLYSKQNALDSLKKIMGYDAVEKKEIDLNATVTGFEISIKR